MILHIKIRKYLKEFLTNFCDEHGDPVYGQEPVHFSRKNTVGRIINSWRRMPPPNAIQFPYDLGDKSDYTWLQVEVDGDPSVKKDELRVYISPQVQSQAASAIYDDFCAKCFKFVQDHLNTQRQLYPDREPVAMMAYLDFLAEHNIQSLEWHSIRRAYDREKISQAEKAKKKAEKR